MRVHIIRSTGDVIVPASTADFTVDSAIVMLNGNPRNLQVQLSQGRKWIIVTQVGEYEYIRIAQFSLEADDQGGR